MRLLTMKKCFSQSKTVPFEKYLSSKSTQLAIQTLILQEKNIKSFSVPRLPASKSTITHLFQENNLNNRNIIMHINPVSLLGFKRLFYEYTEKQAFFKDMENINTKVTMNNPDKEINFEQLQFIEEHFLLMDSQLNFKMNVNKSEQENEAHFNEKIEALYIKQPDRYEARLKTQFKVQTNFLALVEVSQNFQCNVFFSGFNELRMRKLIANTTNLQAMKMLLINCLKYVQKQKNYQQNFNELAKEYVYAKYYKVISNFEIKTLRLLIKELENPVLFAPNYVLQLLKADQEIRVKIPQQQKQVINQQRIEKHAILQVIFGDLWNQHYIINRFPYLTEDYLALNQEDKAQVLSIYNNYMNKYRTVVKNYLSQRANMHSN